MVLPIDVEGEGANIPPEGYYFANGLTTSESSLLQRATIDKVAQAHVVKVAELVARALPKCVFWRYSDEYLLPSSISVAEFLARPEMCVPLKSMFELAGYDKKSLAEKVLKAKQESQHRYVQILDRTSRAATEHIRRVWKDHRTIEIKLTPNGETLIPTVVDEHVHLDMANRSDGFKRFVSFLLQISAKVKLEEMKGALILIDEPEIALHPSGARALMKELITIGQSNTVVYSTHSIFMIDRDNIDRHVVVEKQSEITKTWRADKSRIQDEEVLYAAMGYSIFETVRPNNVVFEGWRDKVIFRVVAAAMMKGNAELKAILDTIGLTHADGVKDVKHVSQFLELAQRSCLIISDADKTALQHQKAYATPGAWGKWKTLHELGLDSALTGEDLIVKTALVRRANKVRGSVPGLAALSEGFFEQGEAAAVGLKRWLRTAQLEGEALEEALNAVKSFAYEGIKRAEIVDEAEKLVEFVSTFDYSTARS